jgi:hypothetical protein
MAIETLQGIPQLWLKEIVVVLPDDVQTSSNTEELQIVHRYLLVYEVTA